VGFAGNGFVDLLAQSRRRVGPPSARFQYAFGATLHCPAMISIAVSIGAASKARLGHA
jgi:hypothetical protein